MQALEEALTQQQAAIERNNEAESKVNKSLARRERLLMKQQEICDVLAGWTGEVKRSSNRSKGLPVGIMSSPEKELFTPEPISSGVVNASKRVNGSVGINGSSNSSGWVYPLESSSPILFEPAKPVKNFTASVKRLRSERTCHSFGFPFQMQSRASSQFHSMFVLQESRSDFTELSDFMVLPPRKV